MNIDRTLFWFKDGDNSLSTLNESFFALSNLLNRLLNENYTGKKIKFINIDFSSEMTYELYPVLPKNEAYYYGGHLRFYGVIKFDEFDELNRNAQSMLIWNKAYEYLQISAKSIKNDNLRQAAEYAYKKGLDLQLNPDYRLIVKNIVIQGKSIEAAIWVKFQKDAMYSIITLEYNGNTIFEKNIDKSPNGVEFFLEMYKSIDVDENNIIIKGRKEVEYLPLKISIDKNLIDATIK